MNYKPWIRNGALIMIAFLASAAVHMIVYGCNFVATNSVEALTDLMSAIGILTGAVMVTIGKSLKPKKTEDSHG